MPAGVIALSVFLVMQGAPHSTRAAMRHDAHTHPALTILFFTATWCEPCRAVAPILEKSARRNKPDVRLVAIDFDRAKAEAARWEVEEIPVVIVLSEQGKVLLRFEGAEACALRTFERRLERLEKRLEERK